jgi:hypothetical protein
MELQQIHALGLDSDHTFKLVNTESSHQGDLKLDLLTYDEYDEDGNFVRQIKIQETVDVYVPNNRTIKQV